MNKTLQFLRTLLLVLLPLYVQGQTTSYLSVRDQHGRAPMLIGAGGLVSVYFGDLQTLSRSAALRQELGVGMQLFAERRFKGFDNRLAGRISLSYLPIAADDFLADKSYLRRRNLHFRNNLWEVAGMGVLYLRNPRDFPIKRTFRTAPRLLPYLMFGIGMVYSNPQALDPTGEKWVELQLLQTEGTSYGKVFLAVPMGAGVSYRVAPQWSLSVEGLLRITNTDYLDDVSELYPNGDQISKQAFPFVFRGNEPTAVWQDKPRTDIWPGTEGIVGYQRQVAGELRGNPTVDDFYLSVNFSLRYHIGVSRYLPRK